MIQPTYTAIPDTSDLNYWELKESSEPNRTQTFVPKDKELHKQLKAKAWEATQARNRRYKG